MELQQVAHSCVLKEPGDEPSEDNLDDLEAGNSNQNETKKRRFHPLRAVRKIFRRRTSKGSLKDEEVIMKSKSTSELHGAIDRASNSSSGDDRQSLDLSQPLYSSGLSLSHDSIFSPETSSIGQSIEGHAESNPSINQLALKNLKDELTAKFRLRQDSDHEDAGLPRSPQYITETTDYPIQKSRRHQGISRYSDGSHLSTGSSDADLDSGQSSLHSSRICVVERKPENADPDLDIGATTLLSNVAARHKISIRPKRTRNAMGHRMLQQTDRNHFTQLSPSTVLPATPEDEECSDNPDIAADLFNFSFYHGTGSPEPHGNISKAQEPFDIIQSVMSSRTMKVEEETISYKETGRIFIAEDFYEEVTKHLEEDVVHEESKTAVVQYTQNTGKPTEPKVIEKVREPKVDVREPKVTEKVREPKFIDTFTEPKVIEKHQEPQLATRQFEETRFVKHNEELKVTRRSEEQRIIKHVEEEKLSEKIREKKATGRSEDPRENKNVDEVKVTEKTEELKVLEDLYGYGYGSSDDDTNSASTKCFGLGRHKKSKQDTEPSHLEKERSEGALSKLFGSRRSGRKKKLDEKSNVDHVSKEDRSRNKTITETNMPNATNTFTGDAQFSIQSWSSRTPHSNNSNNESKYKRAVSMVDSKSSIAKDQELAKEREKKVTQVMRSVSASGEGSIVAKLSKTYEHSQEDNNIEIVSEKALKKSSSQGKLNPEKSKLREPEVKPQPKPIETSSAKKPPSYLAMSKSRLIPKEKDKEEDSQKVVLLPRVSLSPHRERRRLRQEMRSPTRTPMEEQVKPSGIEESLRLPEVFIKENEERKRTASDSKRRPIQQQLSNEDIAELEMFTRNRLSSDNKDASANDKEDKIKTLVVSPSNDSTGVKNLEIITITPPMVIRSNKPIIATDHREGAKVAEIAIQSKIGSKEHVVNKTQPVNDKLSSLSWKETFLEKTEIVVEYTSSNDCNADSNAVLNRSISDVNCNVREDNNNSILVETNEVDAPPRAIPKLRPRPLSQNLISNVGKNDQSELMRVFNRRSLKLKDDENPNVECAVPEKQVPAEEKTACVVNLDCPPVVIELSSVTIAEPTVLPVETSQADDAPQWRKLALLRREQRQREHKEKSVQDSTQLIIHDTSKAGSRSSKVLDMVNSFQKYQVNLTS